MRMNTTTLLLAIVTIGMSVGSAQDDFGLDYAPETDGDRLAEAIDSGSVAAVRRLLDDEGISAKTMVYESPALHWAAWDGRYYVIKLLIDRGADVNQAEQDGYTALMAAGSVGNDRIAGLLLDKGAKIDGVEKTYGMSTLQLACEGGNEKIVAMLLDRGANINHIDNYGGNCLEEAAFSGSKAVVELLRAKGLGTKWPLHVACGLGDIEEVKELIAAGNEVDKANDGWKNTPLHFAAGAGHLPIAKLLVEKGAKLDSRNVLGATMLHVAASYDQLDVCRWLVKQGVDINALDADGSTPMDWAGETTTAYLERLGAEWGGLIEEDLVEPGSDETEEDATDADE